MKTNPNPKNELLEAIENVATKAHEALDRLAACEAEKAEQTDALKKQIEYMEGRRNTLLAEINARLDKAGVPACSSVFERLRSMDLEFFLLRQIIRNNQEDEFSLGINKALNAAGAPAEGKGYVWRIEALGNRLATALRDVAIKENKIALAKIENDELKLVETSLRNERASLYAERDAMRKLIKNMEDTDANLRAFERNRKHSQLQAKYFPETISESTKRFNMNRPRPDRPTLEATLAKMTGGLLHSAQWTATDVAVCDYITGKPYNPPAVALGTVEYPSVP